MAWTFGFAMCQVLEYVRTCTLIGPLWCVYLAALQAIVDASKPRRKK